MLQVSDNKDPKLLFKIITTFPLNEDLCGSSHAKKSGKMFMFCFWECLGKYISKIIISCVVLYWNFARSNVLLNEMVTNVDMFWLSIKLWVFCEFYCNCDFISYSTRSEIINYLMISIFSSTIKSYSFEVFASLSLDKGLVIFDMSKNILFFMKWIWVRCVALSMKLI